MALDGRRSLFLDFLNGLRLGLPYAGKGLLLIVILAEVLNGSILAAFILSIREVYIRMEIGKSPQP